jgi:hypothetical protein
MEVIRSKMVHIDSKLFTNKPPLQDVKILFPANEFTKKDETEIHRLTLTSFNARRTFYSVNTSNNTFYVADNTNTRIHTLTIEEGDYTHATLVVELARIIDAAIGGGVTVAYNATKKHLTISGIGGTWVNTNYFYSLSINNNKTHIILGGKSSESETAKVPLFSTDGAGSYTSQQPLTLFTDAELFLRCSLESNNFSTHTKDGIPNNGKLVNTQLFGRIPLTDLNAEQVNQITWVSYDDNNANYQIYSQTSALGNITFNVVDSFGREIKDLHSNPSDFDNLDWDCIIRWDLLRKTQQYETTLGCFNSKQGSQLIDPRLDLRFGR